MDALSSEGLVSLGRSKTALLTTFRRDGTRVSTPVSIALDSGRAYFVSSADSGKAKRLARRDQVSLVSCTVRGGPLGGSTVDGHARLLQGADRRRVRRLLRPVGPLFWTFLLYRLRGHSMNVYEVTRSQ